MFNSQGASKQACTLLAVSCGKISESKHKKDVLEDQPIYPFPELISSGRLEVKLNLLSLMIISCEWHSIYIILVYAVLLDSQAKILYRVSLLILALGMQVQTLINPRKEEFSKLLESYKPNLVYLQGEQLENDEVGPLVWGDDLLSTPEDVSELFHTTLPTTVCHISLLSL